MATITMNNRDFNTSPGYASHSDFYWALAIIAAVAILVFTVLPRLTIDNKVTPVIKPPAHFTTDINTQ
ncbi:MAG: hypothetical protein ACXWQQ_07725 [Pseudobdellovibrio sp.]